MALFERRMEATYLFVPNLSRLAETPLARLTAVLLVKA